MVKNTRFTQYKTAKAVIHWNYSVNDLGEILHRITLPNGKGVLKTNLELVELGLLARFDARSVKASKQPKQG